jgi:tricorn protease
VKSLGGRGGTLLIEQDGWIHTLDPARADATARRDGARRFPVGDAALGRCLGGNIASASLSPTGRRALMEARGEVFTIPSNTATRATSRAPPAAADRAPVWSPDGSERRLVLR